MPHVMHVQRFSTIEEFHGLAVEWDCLTRGVPFRSWQWLASWWEHYGTRDELYLLAVRNEDGRLLGAAPWFRIKSPSRARVLQMLGTGDVCSDYLSVLTTQEHEKPVVRAIADWLTNAATSKKDGWDLIELTGIDFEDQPIRRLASDLEDSGCRVHQRTKLNCWRIQLSNSWDDYVSTMSKSHRKQVRRFERRQLDSGRAVLHTANTKQDVDETMETLIDLHQRRRISLGEPGCFACDRFSGFMKTAAHRLFDAGMLQLQQVDLDGRAVAAEFHLSGAGVTYAYQAGVDPEALDEEPGRLINIATLKQAIGDGQVGFDFLRGDEPYKAHWRAKPRPSLEIRIAANRPAAQLRHGIWRAGTAMKELVKGSLTFVAAH